MPMSKALRLSPRLIIVPARHQLYGEVSRQVMQRLHDLTSLVEQISIDEAFLDISDIRAQPETIARTLQARIRDELQLPCSIGIASNKMVAKIATEVGKSLVLRNTRSDEKIAPPNALTIVPLEKRRPFYPHCPRICSGEWARKRLHGSMNWESTRLATLRNGPRVK